ncbi:hypothetical protein BD770DRAFT_388719 [Pilaira anomala]|nr:hypothetical protein BD770DRAFT_388719 [Pilaira anomala]
MNSTQDYFSAKQEFSNVKECDSLKQVYNDFKQEDFRNVKPEYNTIKNDDSNVKEEFNYVKEEFSSFTINTQQEEPLKEETYACPICQVDLTSDAPEIRQTHVEECIGTSSQVEEQVLEGCFICGKELGFLDLHQRQVHLNKCLDNNSQHDALKENTSYHEFFMNTTRRHQPKSFIHTHQNNTQEDDDFSTKHIISNQRWISKKDEREADKNDEMYQTTLVLSKSIAKVDKKPKIELNEANIWSNEESKTQASHKLIEVLQDSFMQQSEVSVGCMQPSKVVTSVEPKGYWDLASLERLNPALFTCLFLNKLQEQ